MKKLLLITGDIAAGKTTFSKILSARYGAAVFQKDTVKEILGDCIGFQNREENKALSNAAVDMMCHVFSQISQTNADLILEANFHERELRKLHQIAKERQYDVLTLVLRGDVDVLYERYMHRIHAENRHPVHLSTTLDVRENFMKIAEFIRKETILGETLTVEATDFAYQSDPVILHRIDDFMKK